MLLIADLADNSVFVSPNIKNHTVPESVNRIKSLFDLTQISPVGGAYDIDPSAHHVFAPTRLTAGFDLRKFSEFSFGYYSQFALHELNKLSQIVISKAKELFKLPRSRSL